MAKFSEERKKFETLKKIQALYHNPTPAKAYRELHPKASERTAQEEGRKLLTPDVFEGLKELIKADVPTRVDKDFITKMLLHLVAQYHSKDSRVKASDVVAIMRELARLVPEFSDKIQIEDISNADERELDRKLRGFGVDPKTFN